MPWGPQVHVAVAETRPGDDPHTLASAAELASLGRRPEEDMLAAATARALMRSLVAGPLGHDIAGLELLARPPVRPQLEAQLPPIGLDANISHTRRHAAAAVAYGCRIGVGVEAVAAVAGLEREIATATESARLAALPPDARLIELAGLWTAKEALVKLTGAGLTVEPHEVEFDGDILIAAPPGLRAALGTQSLRVVRIPAPTGTVATVAVLGATTASITAHDPTSLLPLLLTTLRQAPPRSSRPPARRGRG